MNTNLIHNQKTIVEKNDIIFELMKEYNIIDKFYNNKICCKFCKKHITSDNIFIFYYRFEPELVCNSEECKNWLSRYTFF